MSDLLKSLTKPHTVVVRWLNWRQYRLKEDQGSPVKGVRPCLVGGATSVPKRVVFGICTKCFSIKLSIGAVIIYFISLALQSIHLLHVCHM